MKIRYLGHSCFFLADSAGTSIVTDPFESVGFPMPAVSADAVTVSHQHFDHNNVSAVGGAPTVFDREGNYKLGEVKISAFSSFHDEVNGQKRGRNLIFKFHMDDLNVCHLGDLGEDCSPALIKKLSPVDVLLIPVGGNYTIDAVRAKEYVDRLKPAYVIPMHYKVLGLEIDIAPVDGFVSLFPGECVRRLGACETELVKSSISHEGTKLILMERQ